MELAPGEVVIAHEVVDFWPERPAWRLYMVSNLMGSMGDALDWRQVWSQAWRVYEAVHCQAAWGALYFTLSRNAPVSASRMATRLQGVLRFWNSLGSARYLFSSPSTALSLEELMIASCDWVMDAWCPGPGTVRSRLEVAVERMARATREDSIEAILREMPRVLAPEKTFKHGRLWGDPDVLRRKLAALSPDDFERVSGACPGYLLELATFWERDLGRQ